MTVSVSRRGFLRLGAVAGGAVAASPRLLRAEAAPGPSSVVSLVRGEDRRKNVAEALALVEDQILPVLRRKKYVVVKPNVVSLIQPLAASHADALNGILDFLGPALQGAGGHRRVLGREHLRRLRAVRLREGRRPSTRTGR